MRNDDWLDGRFCDTCPQQQFAFCTEERWLQCPASDRCPLYDDAIYPYGQNIPVLPPCVYEDLGYNGDEQILEDYLSNEKRKEKSRDAARYRRSKETDIFTDLAAALPVTPEQAAHLDKASVMRLAIAYLKVRSVVDCIPGPMTKSETLNQMDELFSKALNGFMLVLSSDGNMIYLSENVSDYLGISQMDMMGQSVYEYSHPCDHEELRECLSSKPVLENSEKRACSFFLRLKCTLTSKGRKVNLKSASYKVIHCTGRLTYIRDPISNSSENDDTKNKKDEEGNERDTGASLVLLGCPIPHPSNIEIPLGRHTFLSKHSLSMKFTYADEKLAEYLGWNSEELVGQSVFEFYHALDNLALDKSFKSLFSKGQCETVAYRFLGKRGGYAWVVTQATLIHCSKQQKPLSVVCVNYILSGVEREDEVYSARQLAARDTEKAVKPEEPAADPILVEPLLTTKLRLRVQVNNNNSSGKSNRSNNNLEEGTSLDVGNEERFSLSPAQPEIGIDSFDRATKPLTVTSSTFRAADNKPRRLAQDGSRKDNTFPRPVQSTEKSFAGVQALKQSLEESIKENSEPKKKQQCRQQSAGGRAPFEFQGKPALEYDPETAVRQDRPHVVTRHLFASIATQQQQEQQITCRPPPQTATATIFAPRTEDMNKGFLTFSEDHPGLTMLKDEPEDLTHLAPTPGDVCVPLEDTPFLSEMLDEFILSSDNYCPLLSPGGALAPELRSTDFGDPLKDAELGDTPARGKDLGESLADSDPFMYGDSPSSPCSIDPTAVSPQLTKYRQSPERSIDSLGSPTGGSGADGLSEDEMLMLGLNDSIADDELELRAPYIPMSDQDEALDLLISNDMVMWSPPQTTDQKNGLKWMLAEKEQRTSDSSLAQLLKTDQVVSRKYNDHGGGLVNPVQVLGQIPRKNINLDNCHWSSKVDRPAKRIHTASIDVGNDNKRIKCDESNAKRSCHLEDHLLTKQQQQPSSRKCSPSNNLGNSQLLRRLVSHQNALRNNNFANESFEGTAGNGRQSANRVDSELDVAQDGEGDGGGGDSSDGGGRKGEGKESGGRCGRSGVENGDTIGQIPHRNPACNSVLMNLLVSGCDVVQENLMESRNVPTMYPKISLMSPLSVNLENHQMVPQCPDSRGSSSSSYGQLSPATRKQISNNAFINGGGSIVSSPSSPMMPFDAFDYETSMSVSGLLQVEPDLFGTLLDRNLV
ncbi:protein similar-like isoform X1 [Apis dorsata]|uniref:protein similar-like isoform X1 n=1 Tax=Apis dorsata TaxID=7462 RepID=UPI0012932F72|nr:protein similar-like isoform X1 [Apis dorsata]